jgi:hypothetical protein
MRMKRKKNKRTTYVRILNQNIQTACNRFEWGKRLGYFLQYFQ